MLAEIIELQAESFRWSNADYDQLIYIRIEGEKETERRFLKRP